MYKSKNSEFPKRYTSGLSKEDKKKQEKQLKKSVEDYKKGKFTNRKKKIITTKPN